MVDWSSSSSSGASTAIQEVKEKNRSYRKKMMKTKQTNLKKNSKNVFNIHYTPTCQKRFSPRRWFSFLCVYVVALRILKSQSCNCQVDVCLYCVDWRFRVSWRVLQTFFSLSSDDWGFQTTTQTGWSIEIMVPIQKESWLGVTKMRFLRSKQNKCIEISTENDSWMFDMWSHNTC